MLINSVQDFYRVQRPCSSIERKYFGQLPVEVCVPHLPSFSRLIHVHEHLRSCIGYGMPLQRCSFFSCVEAHNSGRCLLSQQVCFVCTVRKWYLGDEFVCHSSVVRIWHKNL